MVNAIEPSDAVYTLPEFDGEPNSFQYTKRGEDCWEVEHFYLKGVYKVCLIDANEPPKDDDDLDGWAHHYLNWADGDPDT